MEYTLNIPKLNISELSVIAAQAASLSETMETQPMAIKPPYIDSNDDAAMPDMLADANNASESTAQFKNDTYFPIVVNLPSNQTGMTQGDAPLTEDEKRKRTIIIASLVLLVLVVLVAIVSLKKK